MHEYRLITRHYGDRAAKRSGVPLIRHIDEGLAVLRHIGASAAAQRAYCLHPLFQSDEDLVIARGDASLLTSLDAEVLLLAMEYRNVANRALRTNYGGVVTLSPLPEVNQMLLADKVQNRKDFELYHAATHPDREALHAYFQAWMVALGVSEDQYQGMCRICVAAHRGEQ